MKSRKSLTRKLFIATAVLVGLSLVATACGGGDEDTTSPNTTLASDTAGSGDGVASDITTGVASCDVAPYQDPRGGIFLEFQETFNRCHPFGSLEAFCVEQEAPSEPLRATDPGITETEIRLAHIRAQLEGLESIGFAVDLGDPQRMFNTFVWYVNNVCGGVHGRILNMQTIEIPAFGDDIDGQRNAACIKATEEHNAVIVMNISGFQGSANLCLVEDDPQVIFITTQGQSQEFTDRGEGRLVSVGVTLEESLTFMARTLLADGALEGKRVAIIAPDTPGQPQAVDRSLVAILREAGIEIPVFDIIGCDGGSVCDGGRADSVQNLIEEDVDVVFPTLNVVSLPGYINEMATQGFRNGDVTFYNSDFNSQANNTVTRRVAGESDAAGALYNNTLIISEDDPSAHLEDDFEPFQFDELCNALYAQYYENGDPAEALQDRLPVPQYDGADPLQTGPYGMVGSICGVFRIALRALYDAGPNPTREDVFEALSMLGSVDINQMLPSSIVGGKSQVSDALHRTRFTYPCAVGERGATNTNTCIVLDEDKDWFPAPRG